MDTTAFQVKPHTNISLRDHNEIYCDYNTLDISCSNLDDQSPDYMQPFAIELNEGTKPGPCIDTRDDFHSDGRCPDVSIRQGYLYDSDQSVAKAKLYLKLGNTGATPLDEINIKLTASRPIRNVVVSKRIVSLMIIQNWCNQSGKLTI